MKLFCKPCLYGSSMLAGRLMKFLRELSLTSDQSQRRQSQCVNPFGNSSDPDSSPDTLKSFLVEDCCYTTQRCCYFPWLKILSASLLDFATENSWWSSAYIGIRRHTCFLSLFYLLSIISAFLTNIMHFIEALVR